MKCHLKKRHVFSLLIFLALCVFLSVIIPALSVRHSYPIGTTFIRAKPFLLDVTQREYVAEYLMKDSFNRPLSLADRSRLQKRIRVENQSNFTHLVLWYNLPDYVSLEQWNTRFKGCLYTNCKHTADKAMIHTSSAVLYTTTTKGMGKTPPLTAYERPPNQVWIFMSMESPVYHKWYSDFKSPLWKGTMNWSMTYRIDSDILLPYGFLHTRKVVPKRNYSQIFQQKTKFAAWIVSHCDAYSKRDMFVNRLQFYGLPVDIYGNCGRKLEQDPFEMINRTYKFYFALENSLCKDYISEKFFWYFPLDTVLVVRGGADYGKLLPSDSFIDSSQFQTLSDLAKYLLAVNSSEALYTSYLKNKDRYIVGTPRTSDVNLPSCELCAKLNNKEKYRHTYEDIVNFIYNDTCHEPNDVGNIVDVILICMYISMLLIVTCMPFVLRGNVNSCNYCLP